MTEPRGTELVLTGVSKSLGGRVIVDDLDLRVEAGEMVCLLGPSGCGKTTTLRIVGGFLPPDTGQVQIDGTDYARVPPEKRPTAMVFQNYALWPHLTVGQNVGFGLRMRKVAKPELTRRVAAALELVSLSHHADSYPARISGGEQQRAALARALVVRPKLLLLDEPLSNLDARLRVRVREEIRDIQQRLGITTMFVTHDQDEALSVADRIAVMDGGRIAQYATPTELYRNPATLSVAEFVGTLNRLDEVTIAGTDRPVIRWGSVQLPCRALSGRPEPDGVVELTVGVRPEEVQLTGADGAPAQVVKILPRGHFTEVALTVVGRPLRSYVTGRAPGVGEQIGVVVNRALVYRGGTLLGAAESPAPAPAATGIR